MLRVKETQQALGSYRLLYGPSGNGAIGRLSICIVEELIHQFQVTQGRKNIIFGGDCAVEPWLF